jgi:hypothetical protein
VFVAYVLVCFAGDACERVVWRPTEPAAGEAVDLHNCVVSRLLSEQVPEPALPLKICLYMDGTALDKLYVMF